MPAKHGISGQKVSKILSSSGDSDFAPQNKENYYNDKSIIHLPRHDTEKSLLSQ